jgi:hypothetical protein
MVHHHHCIAIAKTAKPANDSAQQPCLLAMTRRKAHHDFADYPSMTPFTSEDCRTFTRYFKENMDAWAARAGSLYGNAQLALHDAWIWKDLETVTVMEMIGAGIQRRSWRRSVMSAVLCWRGHR